MRFARLSVVVLVLLAVSAPSYAYCTRCRVNECWIVEGRYARCYSYGTACLTAGYCDSCADSPGGVCLEEAGFESADRAPLNRDYVLASVQVVTPKAPPMTVAEVVRRH
jgi:hypothetical protein